MKLINQPFKLSPFGKSSPEKICRERNNYLDAVNAPYRCMWNEEGVWEVNTTVIRDFHLEESGVLLPEDIMHIQLSL